MSTRRTLHALLAVFVAATAVTGVAQAGPRKLVPSTAKFYLRAEGCGSTQEAGRLDPRAGSDGSSGCGTIGGVPLDEVFYQLEGAAYADFKTGSKGVPVILDATKKISGTVATQSWISNGTGGVGKVDADITISGTTTGGKTISFGTVEVSGDASPTSEVTKLTFEMAVPAAANKQAFKSLTLSLATHGANFNMNAQHYDGSSFVVFPAFVLK